MGSGNMKYDKKPITNKCTCSYCIIIFIVIIITLLIILVGITCQQCYAVSNCVSCTQNSNYGNYCECELADDSCQS